MTPDRAGFAQPAEWTQHAAVWLAWPSHEDLWQASLPRAQAEVTRLCEVIADPAHPGGAPRGEALHVLVRTADDEARATEAIGRLGARFHRLLYGDIWLRDTLPVFLRDASGRVASVRFTFNGWGGKYELPGDAELGGRVAELVPGERFVSPMVLEGGAIEVDGEGTILTTRQCLLNKNRNPGLDQQAIERALCEAYGASRVLWLDEGLVRDHTDGHVDTLARFVAPGVVVCMEARGDDDPNRAVLERIAKDLAGMTDARGRRLEVARMPSPGRVLDQEGRVMPASYANFYIANTQVAVPVYGAPWDDEAVAALAPLFPGRRVVGAEARTILEGGGAFHCITQQQPAAEAS